MDKEKEQLVIDNQGLIYYCLKKYDLFQNTSELDDVVSVGQVALVSAANTFDSTKGIKFSTYAVTCIRNSIILYARRNTKDLKMMCSMSSPLPKNRKLTIEDTLMATTSNYEKQLMVKEEAIELVNKILNTLEKRKKIAILLKMAGFRGKEIAKYTKTSDTTALRIVRLGIKRIQKFNNSYPAYVEFDMTEEVYKFTIKPKDIRKFKKAFENFSKTLTSTENVPKFSIDYNENSAILQILAIPESFYIIARVLEEMYDMIF